MGKSSMSEMLFSAWKKLTTRPGGKNEFSSMLGEMIPYSGSIGAVIQELRPGYARVLLKDRKKVRNHLGSIHAIALANLGELTTGMAAMAAMPPKTRSIVRNLEISYEKKARGTLISTCVCEIEPPEKNREYLIQAEIRDTVGDLVAVVSALWVIGPEKSGA